MWVLAHSICLPGEEAASLPTVSSDIELLAQSRSKVIHEKFCLHGSLTEAYLHSLSGTTCEPSESTTQIREATLSGCEKGAGNSSFVAGSRSYAKISALQEMGLELQGNEAGFGLSKQGSFAKWSPSTSIWRTVQHSLFEDLELSLEKWPRWGVLSGADTGAVHLRERIWILFTNTREKRGERLKQKQIPKFSPFPWGKDIRGVEDLRGRSDLPESLVRRINHDVSNGVDRLAAIGNAQIPRVAATAWRILSDEN